MFKFLYNYILAHIASERVFLLSLNIFNNLPQPYINLILTHISNSFPTRIK